MVQGTLSALQGAYAVTNDATVNLAIGAADPTNPRRDLVVVTVRDAAFSGANNDVILQVVQGTPAGSPVDPATPANSLVLARVAVAAAASSIVTANITDLRAFTSALGGVIVCNSASRPANPYIGMTIYETDTDKVLTYNGARWKTPGRNVAPQSVHVTTTQGPTSGTTELVVATLAAFTPDGSTEIELVFNWNRVTFSVGTDTFLMRLYDGPTAGSGTLLIDSLIIQGSGSTEPGAGSVRWRGTPSNASHTYTARIVRNSGTGTATLSLTGTREALFTVSEVA